MKLTKEQALELFAILTHYETINENVRDNMRDLRFDIKEFILTDDEEEEDEETHTKRKSDEDSEEEDETKLDEQEEEECEEEDDSSSESKAKTDFFVTQRDVRHLTRCRATVISCSEVDTVDTDDNVSLEFDSQSSYNDDETVLVVKYGDKESFIAPVQYIKRRGNELSVCEVYSSSSGIKKEWHTFEIKKFPKDWSKLLPVNKLIEIED